MSFEWLEVVVASLLLTLVGGVILLGNGAYYAPDLTKA